MISLLDYSCHLRHIDKNKEYFYYSLEGAKIKVKFVSNPTGPIVIIVLKLDSLEIKKIR